MPDPKVEQAKSYINNAQYAKARQILLPLAERDEEAKALLDTLNIIDPPVGNKKGGCSLPCLSFFLGIGVIGTVIGCVMILIIGFVVLLILNAGRSEINGLTVHNAETGVQAVIEGDYTIAEEYFCLPAIEKFDLALASGQGLILQQQFREGFRTGSSNVEVDCSGTYFSSTMFCEINFGSGVQEVTTMKLWFGVSEGQLCTLDNISIPEVE